jgi:hypothetical protein
MKTTSVAFLALMLMTAGCTSWHKAAHDVNVSGEDIVYLKDDRTDLCFAVLFVTNKVGTSVKNVTMAPVPCENLKGISAR